MKPSTDISPGLLDNAEFFSNEFFGRYRLRHADQALKLGDGIEKNYLFPTFYADVTCALAVFFCSYERARELLPHPAMKPVSMGKGRALVAFSCYEYKNVLGVPAYNEIAMTIPIMTGSRLSVPVLPMVLPVFKNFGYYCFSMPVTSLENQIRGRKIWGLPKVVEEISIDHVGNECHIQAIDSDGQAYFGLKVPTAGKLTHFDVRSNLYSIRNERLIQSETGFQGDFRVNKNMDLLFKKDKQPPVDYLTTGDGPSARVLRDLEIEAFPFQLRYCPGMNSCFDLPNPEYTPPVAETRTG
jgi:hypothetical protein